MGTRGRGNSKCLRQESDRHVRGTARSQAEEEGLWEGGEGETMESDCMGSCNNFVFYSV